MIAPSPAPARVRPERRLPAWALVVVRVQPPARTAVWPVVLLVAWFVGPVLTAVTYLEAYLRPGMGLPPASGTPSPAPSRCSGCRRPR